MISITTAQPHVRPDTLPSAAKQRSACSLLSASIRVTFFGKLEIETFATTILAPAVSNFCPADRGSCGIFPRSSLSDSDTEAPEDPSCLPSLQEFSLRRDRANLRPK